MANEEHLKVLSKGVNVWNKWRKENPEITPDLSDANLFGITNRSKELLVKGFVTDLSGINFSRAELWGSFIESADLSGSNLSEAKLNKANLRRANLSHAILTDADLYEVDLYYANLQYADLSRARLTRARLVNTNLEYATLDDCNVYGVSAWSVKTNKKTKQKNLIITDPAHTWENPIRTDDIQVAQFIHLIRENRNILNVIENVTKKAVLILGRFQKERKEVLDAIKDELRQRDFTPIVFDFEKPENRDFSETVLSLAGMSLFIIADITAPKSTPLELQITIPNYKIPFVPIIKEGEEPFSMFRDLIGKYDWVLKPLLEYDSIPNLIAGLENAIIQPALDKHEELLKQKAQDIKKRHIRDFIKK